MLESALFVSMISLQLIDKISPDFGLRPEVTWLGFEGREVKVKVTARSDVKNLGPRISTA